MGSLYSKPKLPDYSSAYVSAPTTPAATTTTAIAPADTTTMKAADTEKVQSVVRRTLPETILTSFRGVLGQGDWVPQRKSLLGE